jgi:hypothetical protein
MSQREEAVGREVEVPTTTGLGEIGDIFNSLVRTSDPGPATAGGGQTKEAGEAPDTHSGSYGSTPKLLPQPRGDEGEGWRFPQSYFVPRPMQTRLISINSILWQGDLQVTTVRAVGGPGFGTRVNAGQSATILTDIVFTGAEYTGESVSTTANQFVLTISPLPSNSPHFCEFLTYCCAIGGTIDLAKMLTEGASLGSRRLSIEVFNGSQSRDAFIPADASLAILEIHRHRY